MAEPFQPMDNDQFNEYMREKFEATKVKDFMRPLNANPPFNPSPLDLECPVYKFDKPNRGLAVIFNNERFISTSPLDNCDRKGSSKDEENLVESFNRLGFLVLVFNDLTALQIEIAASRVATSYKHEDADCFACVFLTHGAELPQTLAPDGVQIVDHVLIGCDKEKVSTSSVVERFNDANCPPLKNKPRLFFIQACRGKKYDDGVVVNPEGEPPADNPQTGNDAGDAEDAERGESGAEDDPYEAPEDGITNIKRKDPPAKKEEEKKKEEKKNKKKKEEKQKEVIKVRSIPLYQDCLIMYATPPGYYAWRSEAKGSWFVQELCHFLNRDDIGDVSFLRGLTTVCGHVAKKHESKTKTLKSTGKKAMPVIDPMLIKEITMTVKV